MNTNDPLAESIISKLHENVELPGCGDIYMKPGLTKYYEKISEINRNLKDLKGLFEEGYITKERITEILVFLRKSKVFKNTETDSERSICETTEKVSMFVLKYKK